MLGTFGSISDLFEMRGQIAFRLKALEQGHEVEAIHAQHSLMNLLPHRVGPAHFSVRYLHRLFFQYRQFEYFFVSGALVNSVAIVKKLAS